MRIAIGLEYHGAGYCGWQSQATGCGIQDHVEEAVRAFLAIDGERVPLICAGRTDAGVHASLQVVHFDCPIERADVAWVRGVNAHLPPSIRVLWAKRVDPSFHARFSAISRSYRYLLLNDAVDAAILRDQAGWFHMPLDIEAMKQAAALLVGEHDFSAFRAAECQAKSPVRHIFETGIERRDQLLLFRFRANAFLHHMIRNLVGGLVYVGCGRHSVDDFARILAGRDRSQAAPTFAAQGLYLTDIEYDDSFGLPATRGRLPF